MRKYQESMFHAIHRQLEEWFESEAVVPNDELCRFLHNIKGTSGTIGMTELSDIADSLMNQAEALNGDGWRAEELRTYLYPLVETSYAFRPNGEESIGTPLEAKRDIPPDQPLVLVLDDDVTLLRYLKDQLEAHGYFVVATVSPDKAIRYFHDLSPDCFILDLNIPEKNGFEVMKTLHERAKMRFVPMTMISIHGDKETMLAAFRNGADDFMHKPIDIDELLARMERQLKRKKQLDRLLFMDELTGAFNRKLLPRAYKRMCKEALRLNRRFALAVVDLDHFKRINDSYGHLAGDRVLKGFAEFVSRRTRSSDMLFRFGGEEFVLLMPQTNAEDAAKLLERVREELEADGGMTEPLQLGLTFSAGIVEVDDPRGERYEDWLEAADSLLYRAKELGRNRVLAAGSDGSAERQAKRRFNIAIVDDDAIIRAMLQEFTKRQIATQLNADVQAFKDGASFLADARHAEGVPYLVILDGVMPGLDGLEVLRRIRAMPGSDLYTVIMLTGRAEEEEVVRALELGADDYLTKPFRVRELEARVKRLLSRFR